jgi:hypothetical protein
MRYVILALFAFAALSASGQIRTFRWYDESCRYTGTYNAKKITTAQLRNTLKLSQTAGSSPLETNTSVWKITDIAGLDIAALDREYAQKSAELKSLDIVRVPYWETFRQRKLRELEQVYRLSRASMRAYQDQRILREYKDAPACTTKFAEPLISGGDDLLTVWRTVNEESRKNNSDPDRIRRIYEEQLRSPDKLRFALIEVMNFGWWNCANGSIEYIAGDETPAKEFKKLFRRVRTIRCDEP